MLLKKLIAGLFFIFLTSALSAQTLYLKPHFGAFGGPASAFSTFEPNYIYILKLQTQFQFGGFYRIRKNRLVFQPEVGFCGKGGAFKSDNGTLKRNDFRLITLQPTLGYILTEGLTLEAGPQFGYSIYTNNLLEKTQETSLTVGARLDLMDFAEDFSIGIRYNQGLSNMTNIPNQTLMNRTLQFSVIYNWYKKK